MTWPAEAPLMSPPQRLRAGLLRGCLRLLFRGLVRPPMPVALQRGVLRGLSLATLGAGGVVRERRSLAGVPCEWLRPRGVEARRRVLYLHGGAYLIGSPATHRAITTHLARRCAAEVCAVDYRRARNIRSPLPATTPWRSTWHCWRPAIRRAGCCSPATPRAATWRCPWPWS